MRHVCYAVLLALCSTPLLGQITFRQSAAEQILGLGNYVQFHIDTTADRPTVNVGPKGGPHVYDFSMLKLYHSYTDTIRLVSAVPHLAVRFPGSALVLTFPGDNGFQNNVMEFQTGVLQQLGDYEKDGNTVYIDHRTQPEPFLFFPSDLGDSVRFDYQGVDSTFVDGGLTSSGGTTHPLDYVVDGYGTLLLPNAQSFQCLRIRTQEYTPYNYKGFKYVTPNGLILFVESFNTSPDEGDVTNNGIFLMRSPILTSVAPEKNLPVRFSFDQNFPNPFNPSTTIRFTLSAASPVTVVIYDVLGRPIATLEEGIRSAGQNTVVWNSEGMPSGIYYCRITAGHSAGTKKMVLVR